MTYSDNFSGNALEIFEKELQKKLLMCKHQKFTKGDLIIRQETYVKFIPFLLSGSLRVYRKAELREILLYYVNPGETCTLSLSAGVDAKITPAEVAAGSNSEVILIPVHLLSDWQQNYLSWNNFVIKIFSERHDQMLKALDSVAFEKIDQRIKDYLYKLSEGQQSAVVTITHQELANELGTTRVVISRILKCLELEGAVELLRGSIRVKNLKLN